MTHSDKAALRGEPSYVWRSGQDRRMNMIRQHTKLEDAVVFDNGCGLGAYLQAIGPFTPHRFGLEIEADRAVQALAQANGVLTGQGESLPIASNTFDVILSNEVIEHVEDDVACAREMVRVLKPGGRIVIFCPNRWYPVEQHGIYWQGNYKFGNIPLVNYLPNVARNRLAPHVRVYTKHGLLGLFAGLPVQVAHYSRIFGGYDNIERRLPTFGRILKQTLYTLENTPLRFFGLSHFVVLEKTANQSL